MIFPACTVERMNAMPINIDYLEKGPLQKFKSSFHEIFGKPQDDSWLEADRIGKKVDAKDHDKNRLVEQ